MHLKLLYLGMKKQNKTPPKSNKPNTTIQRPVQRKEHFSFAEDILKSHIFSRYE